ncbi:MAG: methyltransferase domain-containing protein, partial [Candidatus Micrarchaeia archaeon]
MKLNLGCRELKFPGYINVDIDPTVRPDIIADLRKRWSFAKDESIDEILAFHVIEHLPDIEHFMHEAYRVLKPRGRLILKYPHFTRVWICSRHLRAYGINLLGEFKDKFRQEKVILRWRVNPTGLALIPDMIINFFANLRPTFAEYV